MESTGFRELIKQGKVVIGTWAQMASPESVEIIGKSRFDFVVIDTEHGFFGLETAENLVRAADASGIVPLIRVSHKNPTLIMKALDMGARGVIVPGVSTKEDAVQAVRAAKYAPLGNRGACPCVRAAGHMAWDWTEYARRADESTVVFLLVEGKEGVANFEDILTVEGIDVILMGPFDLSVALGVGGQVNHPLVTEKLEQMVRLAQEKGIAMAAVVFDLEPDSIAAAAKRWLDLGVKVIMVGTDKMLLSYALSRVFGAVASLKG